MAGKASPFWTARDSELARLWGAGFSAAVIADRLETTRNAVIGRVHRLSLPARETRFDARKYVRALHACERAIAKGEPS